MRPLLILWRELRLTVSYPRRIRRIFDRRRWRRLLIDVRGAWEERNFSADWKEGSRSYRTYDEYVSHQQRKLSYLVEKGQFAEYDQGLMKALVARTDSLPLLRGATVLCLGARSGAEVRVFSERGFFAVGIDLNPGVSNRWVLTGDFHDLQFAQGTVSAVYTNSLDHALDVGRVVDEIRRVLVPGGLFLLEAGLGTEEGARAGFYEATSWARLDDLVHQVEGHGFTVDERSPFEQPWSGEQIRFRSASAPAQQ